MQGANISIIVIVVLAAIGLLVFLMIKNRRDRKKIFPPESTDPVEEEKTGQQRSKDKL